METIPEHRFAPTTLIHADGLVIDTNTGEIIGYDSKPLVHAAPYDYKVPQANPFRARIAQADGFHLAPIESGLSSTGESISENKATEPVQAGAKRGPKPKVFVNQLAQHIQVAHAESMPWVDDYVYGACSVVGDVSNGKLNVSPGDVVRVCMLETISTKGVQAIIRNHDLVSISERQAQRIAKVVRFALEGMALYLERNLETMKALAFEVDFAASYTPPQRCLKAA